MRSGKPHQPAQNEQLIRVVDNSVDPDSAYPERDDGAPWTFAVIPVHSENAGASDIELLQGNYQIPLFGGIPNQDDPSADQPADGKNTRLNVLVLDGVQVNHIVRDVGRTATQSIYVWRQDGLSMMADFGTEPASEEEGENGQADVPGELEAMVESIIRQRTSDEEPPPLSGSMATESESESALGTAIPQSQPEIHQSLSFEEAQELTPFDLVDPRGAQDMFDVGAVTLNEPPSGSRYHATLHMQSPNGAGHSFEFIQENVPAQPPTYAGGVDVADPDDGSGTDDSPAAVQEEIEIDGLTATRTIQYNIGGDRILIYNWNQDGLGMSIFAVTEADAAAGESPVMTLEDLDAFVRSIIESRDSASAPEPSGDRGQSSAAVGQGDPDSLTLEEARQAVPFELVDLDALLGDLRPLNIEAVRYEDGSVVEPDHPEAGNPNRVRIEMATMPAHEPLQVVELIRTTAGIPNPEGEVIQVDGHQVERLEGTQGQAQELAYIWQVGDVSFGLLVTTIVEGGAVGSLSDVEPAPLVTEEHMAGFVRSTLP